MHNFIKLVHQYQNIYFRLSVIPWYVCIRQHIIAWYELVSPSQTVPTSLADSARLEILQKSGRSALKCSRLSPRRLSPDVAPINQDLAPTLRRLTPDLSRLSNDLSRLAPTCVDLVPTCAD